MFWAQFPAEVYLILCFLYKKNNNNKDGVQVKVSAAGKPSRAKQTVQQLQIKSPINNEE